MSKIHFKKGDKVRVIGKAQHFHHPVGAVGVIIAVDKDDEDRPYMVEANGLQQWTYARHVEAA